MVERRFGRTFASLDAIYAFVREFFAARGLDPALAWDIDLVIEELFTNVVKYGGSNTHDVSIALEWREPMLTMVIRDFDVDRFDPTQVPPPDLSRPLEEQRAGGRGLHLVRQIADRFEYAWESRNSTITVTKRLAS